MVKRHQHKNLKQRAIAFASLFCLLLQIVVPVGYMPASLAGDGALIRLCPSGLSDDLMKILHPGHASHLAHQSISSGHSGHAQHLHHAGHTPSVVEHATHMDHSGAASWQNHCPYGAATVSFDFSAVDSASHKEYASQAIHFATLPAHAAIKKRFFKYSPRAPPQLNS